MYTHYHSLAPILYQPSSAPWLLWYRIASVLTASLKTWYAQVIRYSFLDVIFAPCPQSYLQGSILRSWCTTWSRKAQKIFIQSAQHPFDVRSSLNSWLLTLKTVLKSLPSHLPRTPPSADSFQEVQSREVMRSATLSPFHPLLDAQETHSFQLLHAVLQNFSRKHQ